MGAPTQAAASLPDGALDALDARVGRLVAAVPEGTGLRVGVACSRFNGAVTLRLLDGALDALANRGVDRHDVTVAWVPGAFELPVAARRLATSGCDAVVCLGAVIRGETGHYDLVAGQCAAGIGHVALTTGVPVAFGVLTTDTLEQAWARSEPGEANKGREAALGALETARALRAL